MAKKREIWIAGSVSDWCRRESLDLEWAIRRDLQDGIVDLLEIQLSPDQ